MFSYICAYCYSYVYNCYYLCLQRMELFLRKMYHIDEKLDRITEKLMKNTGDDEEELLIKGVNVRRLHADCLYSYGLQLMAILFSKEELAASLMLESKRSNKPPLDKDQVNKFFALIEQKFKDNKSYRKTWNPYLLQKQIKCRDTLKFVKVEHDEDHVDDIVER